MIPKADLKYMQSQPLNVKIKMAEQRIVEWYEYYNGDVYVSFSGGKDSTVLLDIVRTLYPEVKAVFSNTGLEFPEVVSFVRTIPNVEYLRPKKQFHTVIKEYGYPVISKATAHSISQVQRGTTVKLENIRRGLSFGKNGTMSGAIPKKWRYLIDQTEFKMSAKCCDYLKKKPFALYEKKTNQKPFVGIMAEDSRLRMQSLNKYGCNAFEMNKPQSRPLSFFTESDIWEYINTKNIPYSKIYKYGFKSTGCMFCMFGVHLESYPNRFQKMEITHPKQHKYCIEKLGLGRVLDLIGVQYTNNLTNKVVGEQLTLNF